MFIAALQRSVIMTKRQNQTSIVGFIKRNKCSASQSDKGQISADNSKETL